MSLPTGSRVGNLPFELSSFVGRRSEVAEVKRLLSAFRLVTLTGFGGVGQLAEKTVLVSGIDTGRVLVDIDDTIIEVHGHGKQGSGYGYSGVRGLNASSPPSPQRPLRGDPHPTLREEPAAPRAGPPHGRRRLATVDRLRSGRGAHVGCSSGDGASKPLIRCDSAFYGHPTIGAAIRAGADVSVTVR